MSAIDLFKQLSSSQRPKITVMFSCEQDFHNIYGQLRTIKSQEEARWQALFTEKLFNGEVIRYARSPENPLEITFSIEARLDRSKTKFQIISSTPTKQVSESSGA